MVLGTIGRCTTMRFPRLLWSLCLLGAACARSEATEAPPVADPRERPAAALLDQASVRGIELKIVAKDKACVLRIGTEEYPLRPTAPCFFLRRRGKVQNFSYADANLDFVVIIAGTPLSDVNRTKWNLKKEELCGEQSQALLGSSSKVRLSTTVHTGGVYCRNPGVDEKEFWAFAHDPQ